MQLPRKSKHHKPGSDEEVPPMTISWMQKEGVGLVDGPVEDHRCKMETFHSVLCRSWL